MDTLKKQGVSETALARVHAPIGIEINAETPQEIAVSIMAEVIQVKRERHGKIPGFSEKPGISQAI